MGYGLATEKSANNFDIGAGEYSFRNFDMEVNPNDVYFSLGNCSAATCGWTVNKISKYDATRGTKDKIAEAETSREVKLNITMDESDPIKYALAMYGQTAIKEIAEQNITDKVFTVSPGDEIFIMADGSTPAYNYENLKVQYVDAQSAKIETPKLDSQGGVTPSTGAISSSGAYTGNTNADYYVKIETANSTEGTITDAEFVWKKGVTGTYSAPVTITGMKQTLSDGVEVTLSKGASGQDFVAGDVWLIKATAAGASLVMGTDYTADSADVRNGKVRFPVDSSIGLNTKVKVSCHVAKQCIPRIYAGVKKKIEGELRFEYDPKHGREKSYLFYKVSINPTGDDNFISEEWGSRQIEATVLADRTKADPDNPNSVYYRVDYPGDARGTLVER